MYHLNAGEHNKPLNDFLAKANSAVRQVFHGKVTYASLVWEAVDWSLFDFVGLDHYRISRIEDKYGEMLKTSFSHGKPVVSFAGYGEEVEVSQQALKQLRAIAGTYGLLDNTCENIRSVNGNLKIIDASIAPPGFLGLWQTADFIRFDCHCLSGTLLESPV